MALPRVLQNWLQPLSGGGLGFGAPTWPTLHARFLQTSCSSPRFSFLIRVFLFGCHEWHLVTPNPLEGHKFVTSDVSVCSLNTFFCFMPTSVFLPLLKGFCPLSLLLSQEWAKGPDVNNCVQGLSSESPLPPASPALPSVTVCPPESSIQPHQRRQGFSGREAAGNSSCT